MRTIKVLYTILFCCSLIGCHFCLNQKHIPADDEPVSQIFDYIQEKAGAEIETKIDIKDYSFISYQNHQFIAVNQGTTEDIITFFDIDEKITTKKTITVPKTVFLLDYSYQFTQSVTFIDDTIVLLAKITNNNTQKSFSSLLSLSSEDNTMTFYDCSSDFEGLQSCKSFYFDVFNDDAYLLICGDSENYNVKMYNYDKSNKKFNYNQSFGYQNADDNYFSAAFLTKKFTVISYYCRLPNRNTTNLLYIYPNHNPNTFKKLNLTFLGLQFDINSAFSDDDDNIWLYADDELLKLKLIDAEAAENEYRK